MNEPLDVYAPPTTTEAESLPHLPTSGFYIVGPRKMLLLYVATLGFYGIAWFYRHFSEQKRRHRDDSWPVARALFSIFFAHSLFRTIAVARRERDAVGDFDPSRTATAFIALSLGQRILDRLSPTQNEPLLELAAFGLGMAVAYPLLQAQISANVASGDPHGETNARFTFVNYLWCLPGVATWLGLALLLYEQMSGTAL